MKQPSTLKIYNIRVTSVQNVSYLGMKMPSSGGKKRSFKPFILK